MKKLHLDHLTEPIIGAAIEVHKALGPGLLESAYQHCLCAELAERGISFKQQVPLPVVYKKLKLDCGYVMDLVVGGKILVELKSVQEVAAVHQAQLLTYLRLSKLTVGLLINFNVATLKSGLHRMVL